MKSSEARNEYRKTRAAFTRKRKISFPQLLLLIMGSMKQSVQHALCEYFEAKGPHEIPSKSAFTQRRSALKHEIFIKLNDLLVSGMYEENEFMYWDDYRLLGIDGSSLNLPQSEVLLKEYGVQENQFDHYPMAQMSCCHDVLNHITIAATIRKCTVGEYERACDLVKTIGQSRDLLLFDRGYGAVWFMHFLHRYNKDFVIRLNRTVFPDMADHSIGTSIREIDSLTKDGKKAFRRRGEPFSQFRVRLVHLILDTGEPELLATSLLDQQHYPDSLFKGLYALRWEIEESYKHLKVHTELENFSGKTVESVEQDFYAGIFTENLRVMIELDANEDWTCPDFVDTKLSL